MGDLIQREDPSDPAERAQRATQDRLPQCSLHHGLDQCSIPGNTSFHALISYCEVKCKTDVFDTPNDVVDLYLTGIILVTHLQKESKSYRLKIT